MKKRVAAILLSMAMVMTFMPAMAFAAEEPQVVPEQTETVTEVPANGTMEPNVKMSENGSGATLKQDYPSYKLVVEQIKAFDSATGTATVTEKESKTDEISTTVWVPTEEDVLQERLFMGGYQYSDFDHCAGRFQAGETYYSATRVKFTEGQPSVSRVSLEETDTVHQIGDVMLSSDGQSAVVAFSVTIPAITVTIDFGSNHVSCAQKVSAADNEHGVAISASGGKLTYKAGKGTDLWFDVLDPFRDAYFNALQDGSISRLDNNEQIVDTYYINFRKMSDYPDAETWHNDYVNVEDAGPQNANVTLYIQWQKPTGAEISIERPVCGTEVSFDMGTRKQTNSPQIKVISGNAYMPDSEYFSNYWVTKDVRPDLFTGTITGGETYRARTYISPTFGYYIDWDQVTIRNGELVPSEYPRYEATYIDVIADHDWGEGTVTREPTTTSEGIRAYKCKNFNTCGGTKTEAIPKLTPAITTTAKASAKSMTVKWTGSMVDGAKSYKVTYRKAGSSKWKVKKTKKTKYVVKGLKTRRLYEFKVAAVTDAGDVWSEVHYRYFKKVQTKVRAGTGTIKVSWSKDKKATGYEVFVAKNKKMKDAKVFEVSSSDNSYVVNGLESGKKYYVKVRPLRTHDGVTYTGIKCSARRVKVK